MPRKRQPAIKTYYRPDKNRWYVSVYFADTNHRPRISLGVTDQADVSAALELFKAEVLPDLIAQNEDRRRNALAFDGPRSAGPRIRDLVAWFTETHQPFLGRADKTIKHYQRVLGDFVTFCSQRHVGRVQQISWRLIQEWQEWLAQLRPRGDGRIARRDELIALRHFLDEAKDVATPQDRRAFPEIPWRIPGKTRGSRFRALSLDDTRRLLDVIAERAPEILPVVQWLYLSGWRSGDVLDFRWGEYNPQRKLIDRDQIKTRSRLPYPVTPDLKAILDAQRLKLPAKPKPADHVFRNRHGDPWEYHSFKKKLEYATKRYFGANVSPRDLRKTYGSHQAMAGCPPNILKELMGHEEVAMTLTYYVDVDLRRMAEWTTRHAQLLEEGTTENPP